MHVSKHKPSKHEAAKEIKVKVKEAETAVKKFSTGHIHDDLGWSEDESHDEEVDNTHAKEVERKLRMSLEKEFKKCFKN